jgi:hypothetical protein
MEGRLKPRARAHALRATTPAQMDILATHLARLIRERETARPDRA